MQTLAQFVWLINNKALFSRGMMMIFQFRRCISALFLLITLSAQAIEDRADVDPNDTLDPGEIISWKITASRYADSESGPSHDLNLRGNTKNFAFWLGHYEQRQVFLQTRIGFEYSQDLPLGRLISSLQIATEGFQGWSLTWDGKKTGERGLGPLIGISRTNLKPYYNLNFDPNDAILLGGTFSSSSSGKFSLYQIADDRLHTGQKVTHLVWRRSLFGDKRITLDLFHRSGANAPGEMLYRGLGVTGTLDVNDWFVRFGKDSNANFTPGDIIRIAFGYRY